ncbi:AAA family ATPase [uncultured Bradyrhizobium sp.]|uniref:AAA family ATPase n=1 Tax=uncultured Bradyrhizobium sp. TaxID=199684 RepID=UPI002611397C|nr:AAA family ATPase [uncultured Bradyrhizobium sp.]
MKGEPGLGLVVLVPGPSWIEPVREHFARYFGAPWRIIATETLKTPQLQAARNREIATDLARGRSVVGVAAERDGLPTALTTAADLTIRITSPRGEVIARMIRMFTGRRLEGAVDEAVVTGLAFHDLVAAFRTESSPIEIVARLRKSSAAVAGPGTADRLPKLQDAVEYGAARTWGLSLSKDIADYRAGVLDWESVDRGAVVYSEPGLGKSLYARILAQACGVPLVAYSIADLFANSPGFLDSVIKISRAMFERAAAVAPCILFLDEIDALPNRATMSPRGADWWTPVITDFLLSLDNAVAGKRAGIVVVAATNNIQGVDVALLRPGRLERAIEISRPDHEGVLNILRHHLDGQLTEADLTDVVQLMDGTTGAEIMMAVRGARRIARNANRSLEVDDLVQATAPAGDIAPAALKRISVHEAAHAVATLVVPSGDLKRCAVGGSGGSAGRTLIKWETDDLVTRDAIERRAIVMLAGRTAERQLIGDVGLGCGMADDSDLAQVTQVIASLHASSGLGDTLAYLSSYEDVLHAVRGDREIRSRVERHLQILQARAEKTVRRHQSAILAVAEQLRSRRALSGAEIRRIVEATTKPSPEATEFNPYFDCWPWLQRSK